MRHYPPCAPHLVDSVLYGHLWSTPELHLLLDDEGRVQSWLEILAALAEAQAEVGLILPKRHSPSGSTPAWACSTSTRWARRPAATGHSTLGLIRCLQDVLPDSAREWVYYGRHGA